MLDNLRQHEVLNAVGYMEPVPEFSRTTSEPFYNREISLASRRIGSEKIWSALVGSPRTIGRTVQREATHLMDLFRYLSGPVETLHAVAHAPEGIETTVVVVLRLAGGGLGTFLYSCEAKDKDILISIETTDGVLDLRGWDRNWRATPLMEAIRNLKQSRFSRRRPTLSWSRQWAPETGFLFSRILPKPIRLKLQWTQ